MSDILIDGLATDVIAADDRGLLYGDHLFETIAFHDCHAPLWPWHWQRLSRDSARLGLDTPSEDLLRTECRQVALAGESCIVRITLTRGSGGRGYEPAPDPVCRRIVHRRPWPDGLTRHKEYGLQVMTSPIRLAADSPLAGMKHGNRLEQVLAARACQESGVDEALVYDAAGRLVEAVASNVVVIIGGRALTPVAGRAGVAGVGLGWLRDQPEATIEEHEITAAEIARAEEVMVINSVAGIRPVTAIDGRRLIAGPVCRRWQQLWYQRLNG